MRLPPVVSLLHVALAGLLLAAVSSSAGAQTATANLTISANVTGQCTVSTAPVAFGAYNPLSATDLDNSGGVVVACTTGISATIGLNLGANASGSTRRMTDGAGHFLNYELYKDAVRTTVWGNSGAAMLTTGAAPNGDPRTFTVYGRMTALQDAPVGAYSDTAVATINF